MLDVEETAGLGPGMTQVFLAGVASEKGVGVNGEFFSRGRDAWRRREMSGRDRVFRIDREQVSASRVCVE